jgi:hypothetical protein
MVALLNQSEYLPNQLLHGSIGLCVFVVLFVFSRRRTELWAYWLRICAYFHLGLFFGVLIFKISGAGFFETWMLSTLPASKGFHPFEPIAHMIEEFATMGAYSFVAVFYLRREYPNVFERPRLSSILKSAFPVYTLCWFIALYVALAHPFPMTGLHTRINDWSVLYRAVILLPGVFYCSIFTWIFWEAARQRTVARSARRQTLLALGSLSWALVCAEQFAWATLHAFASPGVRDNWAMTHVISESSLYTFMGLTWLGAALVSYQISPIERNIQNYMNYLRRMRHLKSELADLYRQFPQWKLTTDRLVSAGEALGLSDAEQRETLKLIQIASLPRLRSNYTRSMLYSLHELRDSLLEKLPTDSSELAVLHSEPEGKSLGPALLLLDDPADVRDEHPKIQLAAGTLNTFYVLNREKRYAVSPTVERALNLP